MELSGQDVRRLALAAQGLGKRPPKPGMADVRKVAKRVGAIHIDSINVLSRAQYLVPFSRLGSYPTKSLDTLTYDKRELYEGLGRSTGLMPTALFPLFRHRMRAREAIGARTPKGVPLDRRYIEQVYEEVATTGPLTAAELSNAGGGDGKWWGWSAGKTALEHLWGCGRLAVSSREDFTRVYDVAERVLPSSILGAPEPEPEEAEKQLLLLAASALGAATARQLADYFGLSRPWVAPPLPGGPSPKPIWRRLVGELAEAGRLTTVDVEGWKEPGYVLPGARPPRSLHARALLGPFDEVLTGAELRFGFVQRLGQQLYVPAGRREYGYYVLPFVLGDEIVGRCDLKADRAGGALLVQAAYAEPGHHHDHVAAELVAELREMASWLGLADIRIGDRGDLAESLLRIAAPRRRR